MDREKYFLKKIREKFPWKESFLVVLAFALTTLAGGFLTSRFQERLWNQQNEDSRKMREIETAIKTFEDLSSAIDRRIYRMDKLVRWMEDNTDQKMIEKQMKEYRDILYEWNDSYNKNKAKLKLYFGLEVATRFDYMHGFFKDAGKILEKEYYTSPDQRDVEKLRFVGDRIGDLNNMALEINERMIEKIQSQEVGVFLK